MCINSYIAVYGHFLKIFKENASIIFKVNTAAGFIRGHANLEKPCNLKITLESHGNKPRKAM